MILRKIFSEKMKLNRTENMNKKGQTALVGMIVLAILVIGVLASAGVIKLSLSSIIGYSAVYKSEYGSICCHKSGQWTEVQFVYYPTSYLTCGEKEFADECRITLYNSRTGILGGASVLINGVEYDLNPQETYTIPTTMKSGERWVIKVPLAILPHTESIKITREIQKWNLEAEENGKKVIFTTGNCDLNADLRHKTPASFLNSIPMDTCQNYFLDYIQVATQTYSYNEKEVICQTRELYDITNMPLKDGTTIKLQGNRIATVQCCPNEANCDVNTFTFKVDTIKQCTSSLQCQNAGEPFGISQTRAGRYDCISGTCQLTELNVECTSDAVCIQRYGAGKICDVAVGHYGSCIDAPSGAYCGDGYCEIGESKANCPSDCGISCLPNEKVVTITSKVNCFFGFPLYIGCQEKVEQKCEKTGTNWVLIIGIIVGLLLIAVFWRKIWAILHTLLNKVGIKI